MPDSPSDQPPPQGFPAFSIFLIDAHWLKKASNFSDTGNYSEAWILENKSFEEEAESEIEGKRILIKNFTESSSTKSDPFLE